MKKIGLTGNIGSGKSYVAEILLAMGYPVYHADREASLLMQSPDVIMHLIDRFGMDILAPDGLPDRKKIAVKVFSDPASLHWLNHLIHPLVMADWLKWITRQQPAGFCFMESAILFEHHLDKYFDGVILVTAPEELSLQRVVDRDHATPDQVRARMAHQWPAEKKKTLADCVIENDGETLLMPQILAALKKIGGNQGE